METKKDLAGRLNDVFGALGAVQGGWSLQANVPTFRAGRDLNGADAESEEEEVAPQLMPQRMIDESEECGDKGSEEEDEGEQLPACDSRAFRRQFENVGFHACSCVPDSCGMLCAPCALAWSRCCSAFSMH